jgi:hypothetical protein
VGTRKVSWEDYDGIVEQTGKSRVDDPAPVEELAPKAAATNATRRATWEETEELEELVRHANEDGPPEDEGI